LLAPLAIAASPLAAAELCLSGIGITDYPGPQTTEASFSTAGGSCTVVTCSSGIVFRISPSATDPNATSDEVPEDGLLYLWYQCSTGGYGYVIAAQMEASGDLEIEDYVPVVGGFWSPPHVELPSGYYDTQQPVGVIVVRDPAVPVPEVETLSWGRIKQMHGE
jgi:hypothetical protein